MPGVLREAKALVKVPFRKSMSNSITFLFEMAKVAARLVVVKVLPELGKKDVVIVSRDAIRHAMGDYWVPEREDLVSRIEDFTLDTALKMK